MDDVNSQRIADAHWDAERILDGLEVEESLSYLSGGNHIVVWNAIDSDCTYAFLFSTTQIGDLLIVHAFGNRLVLLLPEYSIESLRDVIDDPGELSSLVVEFSDGIKAGPVYTDEFIGCREYLIWFLDNYKGGE